MRKYTPFFFLAVGVVLLSGVDTVQAANTIIFQQGVNGYNGTQDTTLSRDEPDSIHGGRSTVVVEADVSPSNPDHSLIRFDEIFGSGPNQILPGTYIENATLTVLVSPGHNPSIQFATIHQMLESWDEDSGTWNSMDNGISANGIEAKAIPVGEIRNINSVQHKTVNVTETLRAWSRGEKNYGWVFLPGNSNERTSCEFSTSEASKVANRPQLSVTYSASEFSVSKSSHPKTLPPKKPVPESSIPESWHHKTSIPENPVPESSIPESSHHKTSIPENPVPESSIPESSYHKTSIPESPVPESSIPDSSHHKTSIPESPVPESSVPESSVHITLVPENSILASSTFILLTIGAFGLLIVSAVGLLIDVRRR